MTLPSTEIVKPPAASRIEASLSMYLLRLVTFAPNSTSMCAEQGSVVLRFLELSCPGEDRTATLSFG